jgi:hypothetical protein
MMTVLIPYIISDLHIINEQHLLAPLIILVSMCMVTVYLSAIVLKPGNFDQLDDELDKGHFISPFFFGNFHKMSLLEFEKYMVESMSEESLVRMSVTQDMYYVGTRLYAKMRMIRIAFNIFLSGLIISLLAAAVILVFFQ